MTLLTKIISNKKGMNIGTTERGGDILLESVAIPDVVCGDILHSEFSRKDLLQKAREDNSRFYMISETKFFHANNVFAIPYCYYIK